MAPRTASEGSVIEIGALEWRSEGKVLLHISTYKGPLNAFAEKIAVERHGSGPWTARVVPGTAVVS